MMNWRNLSATLFLLNQHLYFSMFGSNDHLIIYVRPQLQHFSARAIGFPPFPLQTLSKPETATSHPSFPQHIGVFPLDVSNVLLLRALSMQSVLTDMVFNTDVKEIEGKDSKPKQTACHTPCNEKLVNTNQVQGRDFSTPPGDSRVHDDCFRTSAMLRVCPTRTQIARFTRKLQKQRNRLAHGECVSVNDTLQCLQDMMEVLQHSVQAGAELCPSNDQIRVVVDLINVLKEVRLLPENRPTVSIALSPSPQDTLAVQRLMLSSPRELIGREKILSQLLSLTVRKRPGFDSKGNLYGRLLLHGPPGIGKTAVVRELSSRLLNICPKQYAFDARSQTALKASISSFLTHTTKTELEFSLDLSAVFCLFRKYLLDSKRSFLLIFEDVFEPQLVISLLPPDKHCVVITSTTDQTWRSLNLIPSQLTGVQLDPLDARSSVRLFQQILVRNGRRNLYNDLCCNTVTHERLRTFLAECLLGVPLAIRSFAFQLCEENSTSGDFFLLINQAVSPHRTRSDERAAGRVHVRGFFHVVRYVLHCISPEESALHICFMLSLLPSCQTPVWFIKSVGKSLGCSSCRVEKHLELLSKFGLITSNGDTCSMHRMVQHHIRAQITDYQKSVQDAVIMAAIQTFNEETFTAFQILLSEEVPCQFEQVFAKKAGSSHTPHCHVNQALTNLQLEIMITAFLENVQPMKLDWEVLDICLRCLYQCCFRRRPKRAGFIQGIRLTRFSSNSLYARDSANLSSFKNREIFINLLGLRWGSQLAPVGWQKPQQIVYGKIYQDLLQASASSLGMKTLLTCAAQAILTSKEGDPQGKPVVEGELVCKLYQAFGLTTDVLVERFRSTADHTDCDCALWLVEALGNCGRLLSGEALLLDILEIWTKYWRSFTVRNKEELVVRILNFAECCVESGEMPDYDRCLFWSDTAFRVNNINTACTKTFQLSLRACRRATESMICQCVWQKKTPVPQVMQTWLCRLLTVMCSVPNLTVNCCRNLRCSFALLLALSALLYGVNSSQTTRLLVPNYCARLMGRSSHIYSEPPLTMRLYKFLLVLFVLASSARTPSELNIESVKCVCRSVACAYRSKHESKFTVRQGLLCVFRVWERLSVQSKCFTYGWAVYMANKIIMTLGLETKKDSNPFILPRGEERKASETLTPDPAVIREVVDVFASELRKQGKHRVANIVLDTFETWPKKVEVTE